jgi:hypothetical protein
MPWHESNGIAFSQGPEMELFIIEVFDSILEVGMKTSQG